MFGGELRAKGASAPRSSNTYCSSAGPVVTIYLYHRPLSAAGPSFDELQEGLTVTVIPAGEKF
jgi:hypothetical protein